MTIDQISSPDKPFWSVMIPAYNPGAYFEQTLRSILQQDLGPAQMQIAVVDDGSTTSDLAAVVHNISGDRVEFYRNEKNLGLAGNWNACIARARGRWIHLMHQDDLVLPGYYQWLREGIESNPGVGLAFTRGVNIDEVGNWIHLSKLEQPSAGVVPDWLSRVAVNNRIQCPAVSVRADVYRTLGGFRDDLIFATDWEMWCRIAAKYAVWFEPRIGICYRVHNDSETARLSKLSLTDADVRRAIDLIGDSLPPHLRASTFTRARRILANKALENADLQIDAGMPDKAMRSVVEAIKSGWRSPSIIARAMCVAARMQLNRKKF
jgi:glycosyltransferase involved in cell wall biosynthesis